ncbi:uncharacterized protein [Maniola hyperantus]|uniref:uncharacterized protein n=1 Tax=Aphantopus hyperantus TaxID=2795564 RepID=UPI003749744B
MASSMHISIEKLKGIENYNSWKFHMRMLLIHEELWDCIERDDGEKDMKRQLKALARISLSVQPAAIPHIRNATTAYEAWRNLQKAYEDKGLCRRLGLLRTLFAVKLNESQSMEAYVNKITEISQQLTEIGSGLEDDFVAVIMLSGLSTDYDPLIMALENSNVKLCSDIVKGKLLQENLRRDENSGGSAAALVTKKVFKCFRCKKPNHFSRDCPLNKKKPKNQKAVQCKWVFKKKKGLNGEVLRYKARLVAKGYTQKYGIDYHETFSPVVRYSTIRMLLALAAEYNMDIDHMDVTTAFLNGDLQENVFMEQADNFKIKGKENMVYKLNKAIYGLKQAAKSWYEKINNVLTQKLNFKKLSSEPCVYVKSIRVCTRPDIAHVVSVLSQFNNCHGWIPLKGNSCINSERRQELHQQAQEKDNHKGQEIK